MGPGQNDQRARDPKGWFAEQARSLSKQEQDVLGLLAVAELAGLSAIARCAARAGMREAPTRQISTTSLRPIVDALIAKGLVRHRDQVGYQCGVRLRSIIMRWHAARPGSEVIFEGARYENELYSNDAWISIFTSPTEATSLLHSAEYYKDNRPALFAHLALGEVFDNRAVSCA